MARSPCSPPIVGDSAYRGNPRRSAQPTRRRNGGRPSDATLSAPRRRSRLEHDNETSIHVRRARGGNTESTAWIVERFTPALLAQARYRLGRLSRAPCDAEDLVDDVWAVALPRLPEIAAEDRRATPVLVAFLSTTLLNLYNNLLRKAIRRGAQKDAARPPSPSSGSKRPSRLPDDTAGVVTLTLRRETTRLLTDLVFALPEPDRDIVVLRALEQTPTKDVALRVGLTEKAVSLRYARALAKLRAKLPASLLDDLDADPE